MYNAIAHAFRSDSMRTAMVMACLLGALWWPASAVKAAHPQPHVSADPQAPVMPYVHADTCPFECCVYQTWRTVTAVKVYRTRHRKSAVVFALQPNTAIRAVTGVVVTQQAGEVALLTSRQLGYDQAGHGPLLSLKAGERVYTLHPLGEGVDLFWYQGQTYADNFSTLDTRTMSASFRVARMPRYRWWIQLKDAYGRVGWTDRPEAFTQKDACA